MLQIFSLKFVAFLNIIIFCKVFTYNVNFFQHYKKHEESMWKFPCVTNHSFLPLQKSIHLEGFPIHYTYS